jgi:hypothetical protein
MNSVKELELSFVSVTECTGLFKKKYALSKIYFTSTIEHMVMGYVYTEGRTLKVIFTPYKHSM